MFGTSEVIVGGGRSNAGRPKLPIRLMVSLLYLKNSFNLSDEELVVRWSENILWQYFSGMDYYEHRLPCDATQIGRFRKALGEDGLELLLKATIDTAVAIEAIKPQDLERVIVDTTVQEKAIAHPVDSRLLEIARHKVVSAAKRAGIQLKQTFAKEGKALRWKAGGTPMPNSSAACSACSNANAPSWASSSGRCNERWGSRASPLRVQRRWAT
jgi:IS5 family transposase